MLSDDLMKMAEEVRAHELAIEAIKAQWARMLGSDAAMATAPVARVPSASARLAPRAVEAPQPQDGVFIRGRALLDAMHVHGVTEAGAQDLIAWTQPDGVDTDAHEKRIRDQIRALYDREFLVKDDERRGVYHMTEKGKGLYAVQTRLNMET